MILAAASISMLFFIIRSNIRIKAKLQDEAEELNFMPKRAKLPV
jgi:hypothetical protein